MAAYASLVSLMHTIDHIQLHPHPPISLNKPQVASLTEKITLLQEFLEGYSQQFDYRKEADPLEMRIADVVNAAEDVIESRIADQIHAGSRLATTGDDDTTCFSVDCNNGGALFTHAVAPTISISDIFFKFCECFRGPANDHKDEVCPTDQFYQSLQEVIEDFDSLNKEVMAIKVNTGVPDLLLRNSMKAGSLRSSAAVQNKTMVGFDDVLVEVMDKVTGGPRDRQIIPIVGMGGIGKTTLARNVYQHQVVVQHFDLRAWVTISQRFRMREVLLELLKGREGDLSPMNECELRDKLHKVLTGRRYMIIIDDIWNVEMWDELRMFFPDNKNGSRIVITTRQSDFDLTGFRMRFLDEDESWRLFSNIVFGEKGCPLELEEIGKKIVENCRGLPLSIVVVGGLLAKSENTQEYWEYIAENLNSIVNSEDDEYCLKVLHMSYNQLPVYLKPCFLYMGVFSEDRKIRVSKLVKLWVAEGILRPISGKSLEEVAEEYLEELINRNMVLAHEVGCTGNVKYCKIHDLLRDFSLKQAEKERFYHVIRQHSRNDPYSTSAQRRIVIPEHTSGTTIDLALQRTSPARSLICDSNEVLPLRNFRLLRVVSCSHYQYRDFREVMLKIVNSRCLVFEACWGSVFPSSFYPLWNLQTLIVGIGGNSAPFEIWNMPQLRHLKFVGGFKLPDLPSGKAGIVLGNLQTLGSVKNFKCCEEVAKRIPNIKKLKVYYMPAYDEEIGENRVTSFSHLHKLESLSCRQTTMSTGRRYMASLTFPHSLKKLTIGSPYINWKGKMKEVGSLPLLEKFKLELVTFDGGKWETVEGQFPKLKSLSLVDCNNLKYWKTESSHFPLLEYLVLVRMYALKEIPSEIGEIPTLKSILLDRCSNSVVISAKKIVEEQEDVRLQLLNKLLSSRHASSQQISDSDSDAAAYGGCY